MLDIRTKECITCNLKIPCYNYPNEKQPFYCNDFKKSGMVDISHKEYINCNLSRADKKYDKHCAFCFINLFPNDPKSIKAKSSK